MKKTKKIKNNIWIFRWLYTREEIDEMIVGLLDNDKKLLRLRYGDDLDNPISIINNEQ